jgi:NAD(P)-dependent dehydrogenase (short-subunit alcohol dehydrogenase family)
MRNSQGDRWTEADVPVQRGRTAVVTGANTGLGFETARVLAIRGAQVVLACRDLGQAKEAAARILSSRPHPAPPAGVQAIRLDLASLASVREAAEEIGSAYGPVDLLINNAGVMMTPYRRTDDGFELQLGVNHLGHFALTTALLDRLAGSAPARVVNVSSDAHYQARGIDFEAVRRRTASVTGMHEYAVSKLANVLFTQELARRLDGRGITAYALHPGVVASDIWRRVPWPVRPLLKLRMISPEEGARTSLFCSTSPEVAQASGRFYEKSAEREASAVATPELGGALWQRSEAWIAA